MCKYSKTVVAKNSDATDNEVAVAYLMLKEADDGLVIRDADALQGLLNDYQKDYESENILNEDIAGDGSGETDKRWTDATYDEFAYQYGVAADEVDSDDSKAITDAYELLYAAHTALSPLKTVKKTDFAREIAQFQEKGKMEFDHNTWERVTVNGSDTKYDKATYAWGMLFYQVYSAFDNVNAQFTRIKNNKTLNETSDPTIVAAYHACQEANKILDTKNLEFQKMNSGYRTEKDVLNIVNKTYKNKLLKNEKFVRALLEACIDGTSLGSSDPDEKLICLEKPVLNKTTNKYEAPKGSTLAEIRAELTPDSSKTVVSKFVHNGQITVYRLKNGFKYKNGQIILANVEGEGYMDGLKGVQIVGNTELPDFFQVLGQMTKNNTGDFDKDGCVVQKNSVWDGNGSATGLAGKQMGDGSVLVDGEGDVGGFCALTPTMGAVRELRGWFKDTNGPLALTKCENQKENYTLLNSSATGDQIMTPNIAVALSVLACKEYDKYDGSTPLAGSLEAATDMEDRQNSEWRIISCKDVVFENMKAGKVDAKEWKYIGNYLATALDLWLDAPEDTKYTVKEADDLVTASNDILEKTSESAVFASLNEALVTAREALIKNANANRRTDKKEVNPTLYENCEKAQKNLTDAYAAFHYSYQEVADKIAAIAKDLDDSSSNIYGDANIKALMEKVALELITVGDLKCGDAEDMPNDVLNGDYEFAGYNRVFTNDDSKKIDSYTIDKAKDGPNVAHYNLKTDYEALLAAYQAATETAGKDVNYDVDGDKTVNANDVIEFSKKLANEETLDVAVYDFNGDGKVDVNDPAKLLDLILNEQV